MDKKLKPCPCDTCGHKDGLKDMLHPCPHGQSLCPRCKDREGIYHAKEDA